MAWEKIRKRVKHSSRGPLFPGKGIKGLSLKVRFLGASEVSDIFGPSYFLLPDFLTIFESCNELMLGYSDTKNG